MNKQIHVVWLLKDDGPKNETLAVFPGTIQGREEAKVFAIRYHEDNESKTIVVERVEVSNPK